MRRHILPAVLILSAGCDPVGAFDGPLELGIVAGNNQVAVAGSERLTDPVVGKLVRTSDGGITFNLVTPAYAQGTVVKGSPVPGALVCAVSISEDGMVPWVPCTQTDSAGKATFFFTPGTRADTVRSEIRGVVDNEPAVFDTAVATVQPGPLAAWGAGNNLYATEGDTIAILDAITTARDEYFNEIPVDFLASLTVQWVWRQPDPTTAPSKEVPADAQSGWLAPVPSGASAWPKGQGGINAEIHVWINGVMNRVRVEVDP